LISYSSTADIRQDVEGRGDDEPIFDLSTGTFILLLAVGGTDYLLIVMGVEVVSNLEVSTSAI
jgi:hypothetical protein